MLRQSAAAALAATPYHSLACEMRRMRLVEACIRARDVQETVETARFLHASLNCSGLSGLRAIGTILGLASGKVHAQAAEPSATVETKAARRALAQIIDQIIAQIGSMPSATATEPAEIAEIAEIATRIARLLDDVLASLKGRWGTLKAHNAIAAFLIDGVEPELARLAKKAPIFEIGVVPVYGAVVTLGASFIVPRSFGPAANGANGANGANRAVGPNAILFVKAAEAAGAAEPAGAAEAEKPEKPEWVPITLSTVRSEYAATVGFYRALYDAINTRPDIVAHIRAILLDVPRIGATPWHSVLSDGTFTLVPLVHLQPTTGLAVNQLAIVPMAVTPELASAMAAIVANMTKAEAEPAEPSGAEAPGAEAAEPTGAFEPSGFSYFTIAPAPPAASAAVKRCLSSLTGLTGLTGLTDGDDDVTDGAAKSAKSAKSGREETDGAN